MNRSMNGLATLALAGLCAALPVSAGAQTAANMAALRGLAPVAALPNTPEGRAALKANLAVTAGIQTGTLAQPTLMPFAEQRLFALRDAFITDGNATELADGLGTTLAGLYQAKATYRSPTAFTSVSQSLADLIGYTNNVTKADSNAGKYFFANATLDGKAPVSEAARALMAEVKGTTDVFGKAYDRPAGAKGGDPFGNARPFQTAPHLVGFRGPNYFGQPTHSIDWLRGPGQNLTESPSYPSGHTTYGYTESLLLAILVPERYQEMIARAAEYGNDRIIMGAHYAMDVLGGRTLALHDVAHLLANDPAYVGQTRENPATQDAMGRPASEEVVIKDYRAAFRQAQGDLRAVLQEGCGGPLAACAARDEGRFKDPAANAAFYAATQTYGLPVVHPERAGLRADVGTLAPEAGHLLTMAFPKITLAEANTILTETQGPGGGFLDDGSGFGVYSRLDLYAAAGKAAALAAGR